MPDPPVDGVLFLVPARGGSRRIAGKNVQRVAGIPLVGHAVRTARLAGRSLGIADPFVACSTDDPGIAAAARAWGCSLVIDRPADLATDTATSAAVASHALDAVRALGQDPATIVLLQPTSPLTDPADVAAAVERFRAGDGRGVVSVTRSHPAAIHYDVDRSSGVLSGPSTGGGGHVLTGAFYVVGADRFRSTGLFVEPQATVGFEVAPERSIDVDEPVDLRVAELLAASRRTTNFEIDGRAIGGPKTFVIAEAGVNHNGDPATAHRLVDAAADAGADAVKFQTFDPDALASSAAPTAAYQRDMGGGDRQQQMLRQLALDAAVWPELQRHAVDRGLVFLSTPFDDGSAAMLARLGVPAFKVGSGDLTNLPFLDRLARYGRPLLVSTGMADIVEVAAAVDTVRGVGNESLALLHCVSAYPARVEDANLRAMATMRAAFGVPTGWSDHTPGTELPLLAAALGAAVIEKHLTLDRATPGPDHRASLEPNEFGALVASVRTVALGLGSGDKEPVAAELPIAAVARRSLHWRRSLAQGSVVADEDLVALRPASGLSPARQAEIVGRRTMRPVEAGTAVEQADLEDAG